MARRGLYSGTIYLHSSFCCICFFSSNFPFLIICCIPAVRLHICHPLFSFYITSTSPQVSAPLQGHPTTTGKADKQPIIESRGLILTSPNDKFGVSIVFRCTFASHCKGKERKQG